MSAPLIADDEDGRGDEANPEQRVHLFGRGGVGRQSAGI